MQQRDGISPPQLFLSYGLVAAGALLVARCPGSGALLILDWPRLFLLAGGAVALLFLAERLLSRTLRRESAAYPYGFAVAVGLFGLSVGLVAAVNGNLAREPARVLRPAVRGWEGAKQAAAAGTPPLLREGRFVEMIVTVESWRVPGETIRIPVSVEAQERAQGPGPHVLEVIAPAGFLGVEYVEAVRLVTP